MALFGGEIFLLALFSTLGFINAELSIVEPYPAVNSYPIESRSFEITCVAYDSSGAKTPANILFERTDKYAVSNNMTADENVYFTNRTEEGGRKLFVTLHIRNVTKDHDSDSNEGQYKCYAYPEQGSRSVPRGFSVNVITRDEVPTLHVSGVNILQRGKEAKFHCNMTFRGKRDTTLKKVLWRKDGEVLRSVPVSDQKAFSPLVIKNPGIEDVGRYTCVLEVVFRTDKLAYNVSEVTTVSKFLPWFEQLEGEKEAKTGANMTLQCSAQGYPMPDVEWKVKKENDERITACVNSSTDERYKISGDGVNKPYLLFITNLNVTDSGKYYCCLPSNCSAAIDNRRCQQLTLSVTDPEKPEIKSDVGKTLASQGVVLALTAFAMLLCHF